MDQHFPIELRMALTTQMRENFEIVLLDGVSVALEMIDKGGFSGIQSTGKTYYQ